MRKRCKLFILALQVINVFEVFSIISCFVFLFHYDWVEFCLGIIDDLTSVSILITKAVTVRSILRKNKRNAHVRSFDISIVILGQTEISNFGNQIFIQEYIPCRNISMDNLKTITVPIVQSCKTK